MLFLKGSFNTTCILKFQKEFYKKDYFFFASYFETKIGNFQFPGFLRDCVNNFWHKINLHHWIARFLFVLWVYPNAICLYSSINRVIVIQLSFVASFMARNNRLAAIISTVMIPDGPLVEMGNQFAINLHSHSWVC